METHGSLLKKLIKRKKITQAQAAEQLGFSLAKLNRLFSLDTIDDVTLEEIEKIFQVSHSYFPQQALSGAVAEPAAAYGASCWQLLAEARQEIIDLQKQIIEMSKPNVNAPKRTQQPV